MKKIPTFWLSRETIVYSDETIIAGWYGIHGIEPKPLMNPKPLMKFYPGALSLRFTNPVRFMCPRAFERVTGTRLHKGCFRRFQLLEVTGRVIENDKKDFYLRRHTDVYVVTKRFGGEVEATIPASFIHKYTNIKPYEGRSVRVRLIAHGDTFTYE